jgi:hypothetical protein
MSVPLTYLQVVEYFKITIIKKIKEIAKHPDDIEIKNVSITDINYDSCNNLMFNIILSIYNDYEKINNNITKNIYIMDFINCPNIDNVILNVLIDIKKYLD